MRYPRDISSATVAEMEATVNKYPYFQLLHTLIAKAKHDQQTTDAYTALGKAAIYAPDRRLLRQIFYDDLVLAEPSQVSTPTDSTSAEAFTEENDDTSETPEVNSTKASVEIEESPTADASTSDASTSDASTSDTLRAELADTLRVLQDSKEQLPDSAAREEDTSSTVESPIASEDEDKTSERPSTLTENQAEQHEIVDKFIKTNPSISRDNPPDEGESADLAAGSTALQEDLVTENLAEIMVKQGKVHKARDLYQKLMLKYPEKKTYFAQKIEQLKNT